MNALRRHEQERVEEVLQNLRAKGIRITDTRRAVLSYLVASHEHPSAEKIYRDLLPQFPSMSLATVYNNIKVLIDEGAVSYTHLDVYKRQRFKISAAFERPKSSQ